MLPLISNPQKTRAKIGAAAKAYVLMAVCSGLMFAFGFVLKFLIAKNSLALLISAIALAVVFLALFFLQAILVKEYGKTTFSFAVYGAAALAGFYDQLSIPLAVGSFALFLCLMWGNFAGKREMENLFKIKFSRISKEALPKAILGLAVFSSVAFYSNLEKVIREKKEQFISPVIFNKVLAPAVPAVKKFLPEFDFSLSVDELADKLAESQIEKNPQTKLLPASTQNQLVRQVAGDFKRQVASLLGGSYDKTAKISVVIYQFLMEEIGTLSVNMQSFVAVVIALLVFLTIISLSFVFRFLAAGVSWMIYQAFLVVGLIHISVEGRSQEVAVFD